jgi:hypothetical protein
MIKLRGLQEIIACDVGFTRVRVRVDTVVVGM